MDAEPIIAAVSRLLDSFGERLARGSFADLLCFLPALFFLEIPRYYLPPLGLMVARWLRLPRVDHAARQALLRRAPLVSVVMAGRNEGASIEAAIRSLLDQDYPNFEVIVIDDASTDDMFAVASKFARRGLIRLVYNDGARGRGGRPSGTNLGLMLARGEFVVSLDADTTFDRSMLRRLIEPFADGRVGVVAGNVVPRNSDVNVLTRMQTIEYILGIEINKQWTNLLGSTLQASGAIGAFRRRPVREVGGWDQELAEDTDISLRMVQAGWKVVFAPEAVARTDVPTTLSVLTRQRARWDRGGLRAYFQKHGRVMRPSVSGWAFSLEMVSVLFFFVLAPFFYHAYLLWLFVTDPFLVPLVLVITTLAYAVLSLFSVGALFALSDRVQSPWPLVGAALVLPFYKQWLGTVRVLAFVQDLLLLRMEDTFLPTTAWANSKRF